MDRYSRQVRFQPLGAEGQKRLGQGRAAIVGCGALGTVHANSLARAGAGFLRLIDRDYVELSNLQRQWLFDESDAANGLPKAIAAARALERVNSEVAVEPIVADLTPANIDELLEGVDVVLDGSDNFETRYLINDWCVREGVPWIYGAAVASYGLTLAVLPVQSSCLACVYPAPPGGTQPTCETAGVLNSITAVIGALQAAEALKILAGHTNAVSSRITTVDVWTGAIRQVRRPPPDPECRTCGRREFPHLEGRRRKPVSLCGRNAVQIHERERPIDLEALARQLEPLGTVRRNEFALRFFLEPYEMTVFPDGRAIVKGTQEVGVARSLYARYIGA